MTLVLIAVTAAFSFLFTAVKITAKKDAAYWDETEKLMIRLASLIPLSIGLLMYYVCISGNELSEGTFVGIIISFLILAYAFLLARLSYLAVLTAWLLSILLTLLLGLFYAISWQPLLLPLMAFGTAYAWVIGKRFNRS